MPEKKYGKVGTLPDELRFKGISEEDFAKLKPFSWIPDWFWQTFRPSGISKEDWAALGEFGGEFTIDTRGDLGIFSTMEAQKGLVSISYPVEMTIDIPEANSFRDGEEVAIKTSYAKKPGGAITTKEPEWTVELGSRMGFSAWLELKTCFFTCWWIGFDENDIPENVDEIGDIFTDTFDPISTTRKKFLPAIDLPEGFDATGRPLEPIFIQVGTNGFHVPILDELMGTLSAEDLGIPIDELTRLPRGFSILETGGCGLPFLNFLDPRCAWKGHGVRGIVDAPRLQIPCVSPGPEIKPRDPIQEGDDPPFMPAWDYGCSSSATAGSTADALGATLTSTFVESALDLDHWFQLLVSGLSKDCDPRSEDGAPQKEKTKKVKECFKKTAGGLRRLPPLGITVPFDLTGLDGVAASYDILSVELPVQISAKQNLDFDPSPSVAVEFPVDLEYRVTDAAGNPVADPAPGTGKTVTFNVGHTLHVRYPAGRRTAMSGTPTYGLPNDFRNDTDFKFRGGFSEKVLQLGFKFPSFTVGKIVVDACTPFNQTLDPADVFPDDPCPVTIFPGATIPAQDVKLGPAAEFSQSLPTATKQVFDKTWQLGFAPKTGGSFTLDPEDPCIAIGTDMEPGILNGLGPAGTLVQTMQVENCGDVYIKETQVTDVLTVAFADLPGFTVNSVKSATLTPNGTWSGTGSTLDGTDKMAVGQKSFIAVEFQAAPGNIYNTVVAAGGKSPIGTTVLDTRTGSDLPATDAGSFAVYPMDIYPTKLTGPGGKNGKVPFHILDSEKLPIMEIDPESVRLDGLAPVNWEYTLRETEDGIIEDITDIVFLFDQGDVWDKAQARKTAAALAESLAATQASVITLRETEELAAAILLDTEISDDLRAKADRLGNGNGRLDLGDLRAAFTAGGDSAGGTGPLLGPPSADAQTITLPVTGAMKDETPFVAEDAILVY